MGVGGGGQGDGVVGKGYHTIKVDGRGTVLIRYLGSNMHRRHDSSIDCIQGEEVGSMDST